MVIGNGGVGKTALILRFTENTFKEDYILTIGSNFCTKTIELPEPLPFILKLQIWDLAGQDSFKFVRPPFYRGAVAAIVVFDLADKISFEDIPNWIEELSEVVKGLPIIIVGNKNDLIELREISNKVALNYANNLDFDYIETSAKTGENVEDMFNLIARKIISDQNLLELGYNILTPKEMSDVKQKQLEDRLDKKLIQLGVHSPSLTSEMKDLLDKAVIEILSSRLNEEDGFRFLISGNERLQIPMLSKLFRASRLVWPPKGLDFLYNSSRYRMHIYPNDYKFQIFFLSNLYTLNRKKELFYETCKQANGILIFYDPKDSNEFKETIETSMQLREKFPNLEIILTTGIDEPNIHYQELERLEQKYQLNNYDNHECVIAEMLINNLKRKNKLDKRKTYIKNELKRFQDRLNIQNSNPDEIMTEIKEFVQSMEKIEKSSFTELKLEKKEEDFKLPKNMVFISYSVKDTSQFQISKVVDLLESYSDIENALYYEKDSGMDIVEYMEENLGRCKVFILFCSKNSKESKSVKFEWHSFYQLLKTNENLKIIPIFEEPEYIPNLLLPFKRVKFNSENLEQFVNLLHKEITS